MSRLYVVFYTSLGLLYHSWLYGDGSLTLVKTWVTIMFWPVWLIFSLFWWALIAALIVLVIVILYDAVTGGTIRDRIVGRFTRAAPGDTKPGD